MSMLVPVTPESLTQYVPPPVAGLQDDERAALWALDAVFLRQQFEMRFSEAYYLGTQRIQNLRIAIPEQLEFLRTIVGWPALAVDPYVERIAIDGFRVHQATDVDSLLTDLWVAMGGDALLPLAVTDALAIGRGYFMVGSGDDGFPTVTVESPLNLAIKWDNTGQKPLSAWQTYWEGGRYHGVLMLPDRTVTVVTDDSGEWQVIERDQHNLGFVPLVRMPHQPRSNAQEGRSAITPAIRSITDSACRDLLSLEVAREFYSIPRVMLLGASEADFVNSDGSVKTAWETLISRFNAFQRDEDGNLPEFHQMTVYDPGVYTRLLEMRASQMASLVAAPPQDLGLYTTGNPTSADAVTAMETRRNRRLRVMQAPFGRALVEVLQMQLRFMNRGSLPTQYEHITAEFMPAEEVNPVTASQSVVQQIGAGVVPATSDVVLKRLGYTAIERAQLAQDREAQAGEDAAQQIINAVQGMSNGNNNSQSAGAGGAGGAAAAGSAGAGGVPGAAGGVGVPALESGEAR